MKKIIIIGGLIVGAIQGCAVPCRSYSTCCPSRGYAPGIPINGFVSGERWCTFACFLAEDYLCLRQRIISFWRYYGMNACALNDFARSIAPYFANKSSHELSCIVAAVLTIEDQALRFAIGKALSHKDAYRLNFFWHMHHNPEIIEQPYEDDFRIVYNGIQLLRQALRENNMRKQLEIIERLGFYFENRTIDFIAPLMRVALTKEDDYFIELMSMYLRPYEQLNILVVWDILFNPVKTIYNLADEQEAQKQEAAAAAEEVEPEPEQQETAEEPTLTEQALAEIEETTIPEMGVPMPEVWQEEEITAPLTNGNAQEEPVEKLAQLSDVSKQKEEAVAQEAQLEQPAEQTTGNGTQAVQNEPIESLAQLGDTEKQEEESA